MISTETKKIIVTFDGDMALGTTQTVNGFPVLRMVPIEKKERPGTQVQIPNEPEIEALLVFSSKESIEALQHQLEMLKRKFSTKPCKAELIVYNGYNQPDIIKFISGTDWEPVGENDNCPILALRHKPSQKTKALKIGETVLKTENNEIRFISE